MPATLRLSLLILAAFAPAPAFAAEPAAAKPEAQAKKEAEKIVPVKIGEAVPDFTVSTLEGKTHSWRDLQKDGEAKRPLALLFWCSYCGSCRLYEEEFANLVKKYEGKANLYALACNYDDSPERITKMLAARKIALPVVQDRKGKPADIFDVITTTTAVVIDTDGKLRYRGRINMGAHRPHMTDALEAVLANKEIEVKETDEGGCTIQRK